MFTLVVLLAVIALVVAAVATTFGDPKPATERVRPHRNRRSEHPRPQVAAAPQPAAAPASGPKVVTVELRSTWRRIRSALLLVAVVAILGAALAFIVGVAITVVGLALREAVT